MYDSEIRRADMIRCVLCHDAPCTAACGRTDPAALLRSIWFGNEQCAASSLPEENLCLGCVNEKYPTEIPEGLEAETYYKP